MRVTSNEKTGANTVVLEIKATAEELENAVQLIYRKKVKDITVPGFRKGKAPRKIIEKMYGDGVFLEDAVNELYPKVYSEAVEEAGIEPVDNAEVEMLTLEKETGFTFKATVTVKPEVSLGEYKGINAEKRIDQVTDKDIDGEVDRLRERQARLLSVDDRPAREGDTVSIDFEGFIDGEAFDGGKGEDYELVLGSHSFIDTFEDQVAGKEINEEFDVNVTFPEEYHAEELKGKPALFKVKLLEIKTKELPDADDDLAKDVSEFDTLEELRADLKKQREEQNDKRSQDDLENAIIDKIIEGLDADIPEVMFESRVDSMVNDFEQRISQQGLTLDTYIQFTGSDRENFRKTFREQAERQVKVRLAMEKIVELESIEPTEEDLDSEYEKIAESYGMKAEQIKQFIPVSDLKKDVAVNKAIDLVRDSAVVTEAEAKEKSAEMSDRE